MLAYHHNRQISSEEQQLYDHLLYWVEVESPRQLIERFKMLLIEGKGYSDPTIWSALKKILDSKQIEHEFRFVLNRCARILINHWLMQSGSHEPVCQLVELLTKPPARLSQTQVSRKLRRLLQGFKQTEEYANLQRLVENLNRAMRVENEGDKPLGTLIRRYPALYQYCVLDENSTPEHQKKVQAIQAKRQQKFEIDLSRYFISRLRQARNSRIITPGSDGRIVQLAKNPTLLSQPALDFALKQFAGRVNGSYTHRDLARQFLTYNDRTRYYGDFKEELYEYLTAAIDVDYGKHQFNRQLYDQLQRILPESDSQQLNEFLLLRTCSKLLNFLVVESPQHPQHYVFLDLANNLGATRTIALLLKIVLLCYKVRPHLNKRFSILFNHYRADTRDEVFWLVESLENLNVACSIHFGKVKFPGLR